MTGTLSPQAAQDIFGDAPLAIAPVAAAERIDTLDFIRGIAVMGILAANIVAFGQPFEAYMYPAAFLTAAGDPGGWMWIAQFVLVDGKMRGLFTLLFGAGMYLFMEKAWARGGTRKLQAWRLLILMAFGMVHFFFIWPGDILFYYALFGLLVLACMGWSAKGQLRVGILAYLLGAVFYAVTMSFPWAVVDTGFGASSPAMLETRAEMLAGIDEAIAHGAVPNAAITAGDYPALVAHRLAVQWMEPWSNALFFCFETIPLMLIGMALYRKGFFSGAFAREGMIRWGWIGVIAGAAVHLAIGLAMQAGGFTFYGTLAAFMGWSPLPRLCMVLGLAALLVAYSRGWTGWLAERVRAAGRAAFTNYLGTSVLMMFVFHGWALGLFGQLNRPQLYLVVALAWMVMLAWSKPWLDRYRYGPLEWLWRCLTYRVLFPLKK
ncbi:MAG: DUF418 domain-containing protein [Porphyrobacter sp.]|nr:DUF418 domain-containing protein [Porphyrobacter sp.]